LGVKLKNKTYKAKLVVDATGVISVLRNKLPKNDFILNSFGRSDTAACYRQIVKLKKPFKKSDALHIYFNLEQIPMGYFWVFPKNGNIVNIGVGNDMEAHPVKVYNGFVKTLGLEIVDIIDSGGGIVPIRRPLPSFVIDGFMLIGDSAFQCSPLHGGGIGNAIRASAYASKTAIKALENNDMSLNNLWGYNVEYMKDYGFKSANEELIKLSMQEMNNKQINLLYSSGIADEIRKKRHNLIEIGKKLMSLIKEPRILRNVLDLASRSKKLEQLYNMYPSDPSEFRKWLKKDLKLFNDAKKIYGVK